MPNTLFERLKADTSQKLIPTARPTVQREREARPTHESLRITNFYCICLGYTGRKKIIASVMSTIMIGSIMFEAEKLTEPIL